MWDYPIGIFIVDLLQGLLIMILFLIVALKKDK